MPHRRDHADRHADQHDQTMVMLASRMLVSAPSAMTDSHRRLKEDRAAEIAGRDIAEPSADTAR